MELKEALELRKKTEKAISEALSSYLEMVKPIGLYYNGLRVTSHEERSIGESRERIVPTKVEIELTL